MKLIGFAEETFGYLRVWKNVALQILYARKKSAESKRMLKLRFS